MTKAEKNTPENNQNADLTNPREAKLHKLNQLREKGVDLYPAKFDCSHNLQEIHDQYGASRYVFKAPRCLQNHYCHCLKNIAD